MAEKINKNMQFIADKEIDLRKSDQFYSLHYASTLADTIKSSPSEPFTIGVFGEWGSGKSSIVKTAQGILQDEKKDNYHFFTYDAWKYSKDSFRRTFLLYLAESLNLKGSDLFRSFYESKTETLPIKRVPNRGLVFLIIAILIAVVGLSIFSPVHTDLGWTLQTSLMAVAIAISFITNLSKEYVGTRQNAILFSPEQFEACFDEMLSIVMSRKSIPEKLIGWFKGENHKRDIDHLVIVLDNIDRCERKVAYELLSDFKNFLGKEKVIFVIPVDDTALRTHVASINNSSGQEADEFLRKIFNNTLKIKPYKTHDLYDFTESLSTGHELDLRPDTIDVIAKEYATNPRRIIQFLNSLISEKDYICRRMGVEFVSKYETLVALILLIREEWPELYQKLSDAPYKLRNLQESLALVTDGTSQEIFLRKTHPHTANIEDKVLKVIFTNQDQYPHISEALINALSSRDTKTIIEFKSSSGGVKYLADYMIEELKHAVGRGVITGLASAFNELTFLNSISPLEVSTNKRILGELSRDESVIQCIENFDDAEQLAMYLNSLEEQALYNLQNQLLDYLDRLFGADETSAKTPGLFAPKWSSLIKSLATNCTSKRICSRLQKPFLIIFRDENFLIETLNIREENLKIIVTPSLIDLIVELDSFSDENRHNEFLYLINSGVVTPKAIEKWISRFLSTHGNFSALSKSDFLSQLQLINNVISKNKLKLEEGALQKVLDTIFNPRPGNQPSQQSINVSLFSEISGNIEDTEKLTDLIGWVYSSTKGGASSAKRLIEIAGQNQDAEDLVLKKLKWLHDEFNFPLIPLHDFLQSRTRVNSDLLDIYEWLLVFKDNGKYSLSEVNAGKIVEKCVDQLLSENENSKLEKLFETWVKDDRIKEILTKAVSALDKADISDLPQAVQATTYSHISEGDNIFEYEDDLEILAAMNRQDKSNFNKQIEKVILRKLTKDESFMEGVGLLEQLESFRGMKVPYIRSLLEDKADDSENGEQIKACLKKLSDS